MKLNELELKSLVDNAEHLKHKNAKDLAVSISKSVFMDIDELVAGHTPTAFEYTINTVKSKKESDPLCITILEASANGDNWSKSDTFMTAYRSTSISTSVVETTIKDMAEYYKTNILKL